MTELTEPPSGAHPFAFASLRLDSRVALVLGASRGIGLGIAQALAAAGADIALAARTAVDLEAAADALAREGSDARAFTFDATQTESVHELVHAVHRAYGRFDILVNSAGINVRVPAERVSEDDWDRIQAVNLRAMFFACQVAAAIMRPAGKGKIINVASISDVISIPNVAPYAISKAGVRQLTRSLAVELAPHRINVNAIAPGRFWTAMTNEVLSDPAGYEQAVGAIPWGRLGEASDLGGAAVLLASDAGDYITGQTIHLCGGQSLAPPSA